jgi:hypothetical protein
MVMLGTQPKHQKSTQLEAIDELYRVKIDMLNYFMQVLPNGDA